MNGDRVDNARDDDDNDDDDDDDMDLALEMMDGSWSMLLTLVGDEDNDDDDDGGEDHRGGGALQSSWALDQLPRVLRCIGDLYSYRNMHGTALDYYIRSMQYRERAWGIWEEERNGNNCPKKDDDNGDTGDDVAANSTTSSFDASLDGLRRKRHLVEAYALVAEELLASPEGEDVVARRPYDDVGDDDDDDDGGTEGAAAMGVTRQGEITVVLARAVDRLDYARGHYEMARTGLEDVLCRYAKLATMATDSMDLGNEKEDIGYLVVTVVGVGMTIDEQDQRR
jgi:hypothetical protein